MERLSAAESKKTVLVCDDEPEMLAVVEAMLEHHGYGVRTTTQGEEALRIASAEKIDVIMIDLLMPSMSGWELIAALRSDMQTRRIPIIVLSSISPHDLEVAARSIQGWVEKPLDEANLISVVSRVLENAQVEGARILVVEDNDTTASILQALLERHGMTCYRARNGVEAIDVASWCRPDLLVLDVLLPDIDGYSVIKWLRKDDQLRATPVIVYSGANITEADRHRLELGPTQFISKGQLPIRTVEQKALQILADLLKPANPK